MRRRWLYLAAGVMAFLFIGVIYAWSIMKTPLAEEFGYSDSTLAAAYTVSIIFFCLGSIASGFLSKKIKANYQLLFAGILVLGGFVLLSGMGQADVFRLNFFYGALVSTGVGIAYNVLIAEVTAWFPDMRGLCSGVLMLGFGMSAMLVGQIATALFQNGDAGWRKVYSGLGILCFCVLFLSSAVLRAPRQGDLPEPQRKEEKAGMFDGLTAGETIKSASFWLFYLYGAAGSVIGSTIISFARDFAVTVGAAASTAALFVGVLSVCNGVGRIICGLFYDRFGGKRTLPLIALLTVCVPVILLAASGSRSAALLAAGFALAGITYGSYPTVSASFISEEYGRRDFSINYSISNSKLLFSSFGAAAAGMLLERTGSYRMPLVMLAGFAVAALLLSFTIRYSGGK